MIDKTQIDVLQQRIQLQPTVQFGSGPETLPPPATDSQIAAAERRIGCTLHKNHRQLLLEVANGGFGPGYGVVGVDDGFHDPDGGALESSHDLIVSMSDSLPEGFRFAPLCDWGAAIWSVLSCTDGMVYVFYEGSFYQTNDDLTAWISKWLDNKDIWASMFAFSDTKLPGLPPMKRIASVNGRKVS
ncbi:MAG: SMI1/KNR4 family protein [Planctomycetaceae bacterium]